MIGASIKEKRIRLGMTQERFAELIGCSQSNVSKYERPANKSQVEISDF